MANEVISEAELTIIKKDEYYVLYEMMMQALRTDNVHEGLNKSLYLLRKFLDSGHVVLYKKNGNGRYVYKISDMPILTEEKTINHIINKTQSLIENKGIFDIDMDFCDNLKNMKLIHIKLNDTDYILSISKYDTAKEYSYHFLYRVKETMQILLKRAESYEKNKKAITTDLLTGIDNRNSYEMRISDLDESEENLVFGIFDLFRLKYINDNFSHTVGDEYIKKTAEILKKYWPKYKYIDDENEKTIETGTSLYRVGGDEFILLAVSENQQLTELKAKLAAEEVSMIDLDIEENLPVGLNYGIVHHQSGDKLKETYDRADKLMSDDKKKMYVKHGLERRR